MAPDSGLAMLRFFVMLSLWLEQKDNKPDNWISLLKGMRLTLQQKKFKQVRGPFGGGSGPA